MTICLEVSMGWEKGICKSASMVMVFKHRILHVFLAEQHLSSAKLEKQSPFQLHASGWLKVASPCVLGIIKRDFPGVIMITLNLGLFGLSADLLGNPCIKHIAQYFKLWWLNNRIMEFEQGWGGIERDEFSKCPLTAFPSKALVSRVILMHGTTLMDDERLLPVLGKLGCCQDENTVRMGTANSVLQNGCPETVAEG